MDKKNLGLFIFLLGVLLSIFAVGKAIIVKKNPAINNLKEASYYTKIADGKVRCQLCPNNCILSNSQRGLCNVRQNIGGKLYSLVYGKPVAINIDPIEKKPFFHFLPGARTYSLATAGCNLDCQYCQNWDIAHRLPEEVNFIPLSANEVVDQAIKSNSQVIAFTYNEPTVWYEYMYDIAKLAKENKLRTVLVSSGYINPEPLKNLLPYLDAARIDLKSFNTQIYQDLIRGQLEPVLETIKTIHESRTWLELIHLVVPGYTDDLEEIKKMCQWIKENVGENVPVHFTRFWPQYKLLNLPPTAEESIKKARNVCLSTGVKFVYTGNIEDKEGSSTYCPDNNQVLITRQGFFLEKNFINKDGKSTLCPSTIPGVWQ